MATRLTLAIGLTLLWAWPQIGLAQTSAKNRKPTTSKKAPQQTTDGVSAEKAKVQSQLRRTMAQLIVARGEEEPDRATIDKLTRQLDSLRTRARELGVTGSLGGQANCPWNGGGQWGVGMRRGGPPAGRGPGAGAGNCPNGVCPLGNCPGGNCWRQGQGRGGAGAAAGTGAGRGRGGPGWGRGARGGGRGAGGPGGPGGPGRGRGR